MASVAGVAVVGASVGHTSRDKNRYFIEFRYYYSYFIIISLFNILSFPQQSKSTVIDLSVALQAKDQQQHEQHECPMRIVVCSVCQLEVQACELDTHKKEVCQMAELDDPSAVVQSTQELLGHWTSSPSKQEPPAAEEPAAEEAVVVEEEPSAEEAAAAEEVAELMQKLKALQEGAPAAEDPNK